MGPHPQPFQKCLQVPMRNFVIYPRAWTQQDEDIHLKVMALLSSRYAEQYPEEARSCYQPREENTVDREISSEEERDDDDPATDPEGASSPDLMQE